jgi:hypothetical protein
MVPSLSQFSWATCVSSVPARSLRQGILSGSFNAERCGTKSSLPSTADSQSFFGSLCEPFAFFAVKFWVTPESLNRKERNGLAKERKENCKVFSNPGAIINVKSRNCWLAQRWQVYAF